MYQRPDRAVHGQIVEQAGRTYGDYIIDAAECNAALKYSNDRLRALEEWRRVTCEQ